VKRLANARHTVNGKRQPTPALLARQVRRPLFCFFCCCRQARPGAAQAAARNGMSRKQEGTGYMELHANEEITRAAGTIVAPARLHQQQRAIRAGFRSGTRHPVLPPSHHVAIRAATRRSMDRLQVSCDHREKSAMATREACSHRRRVTVALRPGGSREMLFASHR